MIQIIDTDLNVVPDEKTSQIFYFAELIKQNEGKFFDIEVDGRGFIFIKYQESENKFKNLAIHPFAIEALVKIVDQVKEFKKEHPTKGTLQ